MTPEQRHLRADAERNRTRLLEAAEALFDERGLDVGVAEIAERAGVGRGTLFRNFPTKEDLIAAIVARRMREVAADARELVEAADPGLALFELLERMAGEQQLNRALFEAIEDVWLANEEIAAAHSEVLGALDELLRRAQQTGAVRADIGAMDVMLMFKGLCEAASAFSHVDPTTRERQLDLLCAALTPAGRERPLRGRPATLADLERARSRDRARPTRRAAG